MINRQNYSQVDVSMPIKPARELKRISQEAFHEIDYLVTGLAFHVHRELGPWFIDESIYRDELARLCRAKRLTACTELPVIVMSGTFSKSYFLDLVINECVPYEMKAVEKIHRNHRNQTLNYLMLTGLAHAKILNMRSSSMEYEFVSTTVTPADRYEFKCDFDCWRDLDADSNWLKDAVHKLIDEWGLFLDVTLFYDAIEHLRGGRENVVQPIEIARGSQVVGRQLAHLINSRTGFKITAITKDIPQFEKRLAKFLSSTSLHAVQWINFNRHNVCFKTLLRDSTCE
ncbi:MAG: GxxExxY protein [Pirellulales bacterium]